MRVSLYTCVCLYTFVYAHAHAHTHTGNITGAAKGRFGFRVLGFRVYIPATTRARPREGLGRCVLSSDAAAAVGDQAR